VRHRAGGPLYLDRGLLYAVAHTYLMRGAQCGLRLMGLQPSRQLNTNTRWHIYSGTYQHVTGEGRVGGGQRPDVECMYVTDAGKAPQLPLHRGRVHLHARQGISHL
jgi:hypothetical protein